MRSGRLTLVRGPLRESFEEQVVVIGRSPLNEIVLSEASVARRHAQCEPRAGRWVLIDNGSSNGTVRDGARITNACLKTGDRLNIGVVEIDVELEAPRFSRPLRSEAEFERQTYREGEACVALDGRLLVRVRGYGRAQAPWSTTERDAQEFVRPLPEGPSLGQLFGAMHASPGAVPQEILANLLKRGPLSLNDRVARDGVIAACSLQPMPPATLLNDNGLPLPAPHIEAAADGALGELVDALMPAWYDDEDEWRQEQLARLAAG